MQPGYYCCPYCIYSGKIYMYYYNRTIGHKIDSTAMQATAGDSLRDTVSTSLVLLATIISQLTGLVLDDGSGVLVGILSSIPNHYNEGYH